MVDREGLSAEFFRRAVSHGFENYLLSMLYSPTRFLSIGASSWEAYLTAAFVQISPLRVFCSFACITVCGIFFPRVLSSDSLLFCFAVYFIQSTYVNGNIGRSSSLIYVSAVYTSIMCYFRGELLCYVHSRSCFIFPSLAVGSFKLTMIPCSDSSGFVVLFRSHGSMSLS
jgi:hypothetical protein